MPKSGDWTPGVEVEHSQEEATGVITQGAGGTRSDVLFASNDDKMFGAPIKVLIKGSVAADAAYDAAAAIHTVLSKPTLANKYRITNVETVLRSLRTGGTPDHDIKVEVGDGAASEAFTDAVADVDIDGDTVGLPTQRIVVNSVDTVWSTGRTLRCQLAVSGTTTTGTAEVDFIITLVPTNEAIA
jgi:hypothetical protein